MKHALVLLMVLSACGMEGAPLDEGSVEQAVVLEPPLDAPPIDPVALAACIDLPDELTVDWLKQRLVYNQGCYASWAVQIEGVACPIGDRTVDGALLFAGDAMAQIPQTGLLIRARAASAALVDLAALATGGGQPRVELDATGDHMSLSACTVPIDNGRHSDMDVAVDSPVLGALDIGGAVDVSRADGTRSADFAFALAAQPPSGPAVNGELTGTGIQRQGKAMCPVAGQVRFTGSIGDAAADVVLDYLGDGQVELTLSNGDVVGPVTPLRCK